MLRSVYVYSLRSSWRSLVGWGAGLVVLALYVMLLYPSVRGSASQVQQLIDQLPSAIRNAVLGEAAASDYGTPAGYVQSELFSMMVPLLFLFFAIAHGSRAVAGEEEKGELELVLATPLPRHILVLAEFAALATASAALALLFWSALSLAALAVGASLSPWGTLQATASAWLLGLLFGGIALSTGCLRGRRSIAIAVATVLGVAAYLFNALGLVVQALDPYRVLSPFQWYLGGFLVRDGLAWTRATALVVATGIVVVAGTFALRRRDVGC